MNEQQKLKFLGSVVENGDGFKVLSDSDTDWVIHNTKDAIAICVEAIKNRSSINTTEIKESEILQYLGLVNIPAFKEKFIACDNFIKTNKKIAFHGFGSNFENWFLGKVEDHVNETNIRYDKITKNLLKNNSIIAELGGKKKVPTTLAELYSLLVKQGNGKKGVLLDDGSFNIFYILDTNGILRTVSVRWYDNGWSVRADQVETHNAVWNVGHQVFSQNI